MTFDIKIKQFNRFLTQSFIVLNVYLNEQRKINQVDLIKLYFQALQNKFYLPLFLKNQKACHKIETNKSQYELTLYFQKQSNIH